MKNNAPLLLMTFLFLLMVGLSLYLSAALDRSYKRELALHQNIDLCADYLEEAVRRIQ